jgi:redox-sensitive bicupin YhaK (pirin superfamily)
MAGSCEEGNVIKIRPSVERGAAKLDWLDSRHSFSFDQYYDPAHMGFRSLRVINEDRVAAGMGFGMHPHKDMEILTWILQGALTHRDNMGHAETIRPGELQHMTAGTGVVHSEMNPSKDQPVHLLQIWIEPGRRGLKPEYEQLFFQSGDLQGKFALLAGPEGPVTIHQDVNLYATRLVPGETARMKLQPGRYGWLQLAAGEIELNGNKIEAGDGAAISDEGAIICQAAEKSEALLFDLA